MKSLVISLVIITIVRTVYNIATKFTVDYSMFLSVLFFVSYNGIVLYVILWLRSKIKSAYDKAFLRILSLPYVLIILANISTLFFCETKDCYKSIVNNWYLDFADISIIAIGLYILWTNSEVFRKASR